MQEEIEHKTVNFAISTTKLSARTLLRGMQFLLRQYLAIQSCEDGWDYTIYHSDFSVMDGGQLDAPELTIQEAREQILEAHHMEKGRRLLQDYDAVMDKVAETEERSADHRPSTLEKLAALASDTSAPKSSARSAPEL